MTDWREDDAKFSRFLREGWEWEDRVIERLRGEGFSVRVPARSIRNTFSDRIAYQNQTDCFIETANGDLKIEIKGRNLAYTGPADIPFPTLIVEELESWNHADPKPTAILLISKKTSEIVAAMGEDCDMWQKEKRYDNLRACPRWFLLAKRETLLTYEELVGELRSRISERDHGARPLFDMEVAVEPPIEAAVEAPELVEAPAPIEKRDATTKRLEALMYLDGWESKERCGRKIWQHPEHTGGYWTSAAVAREWAQKGTVK